jgi:hypothetical protein
VEFAFVRGVEFSGLYIGISKENFKNLFEGPVTFSRTVIRVAVDGQGGEVGKALLSPGLTPISPAGGRDDRIQVMRKLVEYYHVWLASTITPELLLI